MKVAFFGTPAFAVPTLDALLASSHDVVAVITQPDRARGRGQRVTFAPVKARAVDAGITVLQPERLRDDTFRAAFEALDVDLGVVAAYGRILPQALLDRPRYGMINVHASLLPRWRGAAPVHRAILAGDSQTGVTIMRVVAALDAGPMLLRDQLMIGPDETSAELEARLAMLGAGMLVHAIDAMATGSIDATEQDESLVTYAHRIERQDGDVAWTRPARAIHDQIRGLHPWPHAAALLHGRRVMLIASQVEAGAVSSVPPGQIVGVSADGIDVAALPGIVRLTRLQPEGRPAMSVRDFLNGRTVHVGDRLEPVVRTP